MFCEPYSDLSFWIFSSEAPYLLYYSHLPAALTAIFVGSFILFKVRQYLPAKLLFVVCFLFFSWSIMDLFIWTQSDSRLIMFLWSFWFPIFVTLFATGFYFVYSFTKEKDLSTVSKSLIVFSILPVFILSNTPLNLESFDLIGCNAVEHQIMVYYSYVISIGYLLLVIGITIRSLIAFIKDRGKGSHFYVSLGMVLFLFSFSASTLVASLANYVNSDYSGSFEIEQYGFFGMTIFIVFLSYSIVKFKLFNLKLITAQALVITLWILIGSLLFVVKSDTSRIIAAITLLITTFAGYSLVRSVKNEIKQREELEVLTKNLERVNARLRELDKAKSEFVSIASHQLRSPLTAIRGYASMLAEGSFGKMPEKAMESAKRIEDSAKLMAMSIEDYLNISRIESGNMKYNLSDFNLYEMTDKLCDDLRPEALKKGLILLFRSDMKSKGIVHADIGKVNQIIHNLINNSIKYTPRGSISVFVRDNLEKKRIYVDIIDTGIGMSQATMTKLFNKFTRADNANTVNVSGTGLGLYVALKMAEAMGGSISCASEGDGKGSTFTFELPVVM